MSALAFVSATLFLLLGVFAAANWSAFTAPVSLSLLVTTIEAPLGLLMLIAVLAVGGVNLALAVASRTQMLVESRRLSRDLQAQRDLAERAEASRLSELRSYLEREFSDLRASVQRGSDAAGARMDSLESAVTRSLSDGVNTLSASLGEVEDKLDRALPAEGSRS